MDADLASLIIRLAIGPMLVAHGANKIAGRGGLAGTTSWFASLGLRPAAVQARVAAFTEICVGLLLVSGLLTPLACAATVGLMVVATRTDHRGKGYFVFKGGAEYTIFVAIIAVGLAALGAGSWSIDEIIGVDLNGWAGASFAVVLGTLSAVGLLAACYRPAQPSA